jgi:hypothetical protein
MIKMMFKPNNNYVGSIQLKEKVIASVSAIKMSTLITSTVNARPSIGNVVAGIR